MAQHIQPACVTDGAIAQCDLESEPTRDSRVFVPRTDIYESGDHIYLVAEMPGVDDQSVDITLHKNVLTIAGKSVVQTPEGSPVITEYELGGYRRSFTLSESVDRDGIEASMHSGVLRLRLPKAEEARARKIQVKSE